MQRSRADLFTLLPYQIMGSFCEKLLLPVLHFVALTFLPMPLVSVTRSAGIAMGNGQFMLFRNSVYRKIGGHASVRSALVEDVWLARRIKEFGYRLVIRDGASIVSCRMYTSLRGVWHGFSKNLFAGFRYSLPAIIAVSLLLVMTSVLPFVFFGAELVRGTAGGQDFAFLVGQVALILSIRLMTAVRFRMPGWSALLHPFAIMLFVGIAVNSCRWVLFTGGARWKGRTYDFRHQSVV
jgi:chlorobactene glucosyltransferase